MTQLVSTIFPIMLGGALGAVVRYFVAVEWLRVNAQTFPVGTLIVNLVGCFLIGIAYGILLKTGLSDALRHFWITGFLGALTTFSAFGLDIFLLSQTQKSLALLLSYLSLSVLGGTVLVFLGIKLTS